MKYEDSLDLAAHVADPSRLAALRAVALLDTPAEDAFDRLTRLAAKFTSAPIALVTLIDSNRQFFKSCQGLPEPWQSMRETPLSYSICQYNRVPRHPLLIHDARRHPVFKDNLAVRDLNAIAYLGIPLVTPDGYILGSFCVIDSKPRQWDDGDVTVVEDLAAAVMTEIYLRTEIKVRIQAEETRNRALEELRERDQMLMQQSRHAAMGEMISNIAHQWRQPLNILALHVQELPVIFRKGKFNQEYLNANVQKMMNTIEYMSKTIDNFLTFFSPLKKKVHFKVKETLEKTLSLIGDSLKDAGITTRVVVRSNPVISGYPNEFCEVLLNILANSKDAFAVHEVPDAQISIEVGTECDKSVVEITDNAGGIPPEIQHKIFDPYFTTKGPDRGTGLGLYISKIIVEKNMGGSLTAENINGGVRLRIKI